jgi:hypothetical protein
MQRERPESGRGWGVQSWTVVGCPEHLSHQQLIYFSINFGVKINAEKRFNFIN